MAALVPALWSIQSNAAAALMNFAGQPARLYSLPCCYTALYARGGRDLIRGSLTKDQVKELQIVLPASFIEKDKRFHYLAGMLEHAAKNKKPELVNFYFSEMTESCGGCHAKFATHKFPALLTKGNTAGHHH